MKYQKYLFYFLLGLRGRPELVGRVGQVDHTHMHGLEYVDIELFRLTVI